MKPSNYYSSSTGIARAYFEYPAMPNAGLFGQTLPLSNIPEIQLITEAGEHLSKSQYHNPLHDAWRDLIASQDWQWFVTFTFKEEIHPESADKLYRVWINKLNRAIYGKRWRNRKPFGVKHVRALEWQKRGVLHYHSLIANVGFEDREHWAEVWQKLGLDSKAGFIRIDQYDESKGGAEAYLSKYVTKGGQIDISDNFKESNYIKPTPSHVPNKQKNIQARY